MENRNTHRESTLRMTFVNTRMHGDLTSSAPCPPLRRTQIQGEIRANRGGAAERRVYSPSKSGRRYR